MAVSGQDVQAMISSALTQAQQTDVGLIQFMNLHGKDWTKWPKLHPWYTVFLNLNNAKEDAGTLIPKPKLTAAFSVKS